MHYSQLWDASASPSRNLVSQDIGRKEERAGPCDIAKL